MEANNNNCIYISKLIVLAFINVRHKKDTLKRYLRFYFYTFAKLRQKSSFREKKLLVKIFPIKKVQRLEGHYLDIAVQAIIKTVFLAAIYFQKHILHHSTTIFHSYLIWEVIKKSNILIKL